MRALRLLLLPFSLIYALIIRVRHLLFDTGIFSSTPGRLPAIVIGNLSVGGSGKTPFTLFLARRLTNLGVKPAILSRGYRRTTTGFVLAGPDDHAASIGDEPSQMHRALPDIPLAVCENRLEGIRALANASPAPEMVVLDDAFQHRALNAELNILLTPYEKPWWKDFPLPAGDLRDIPYARSRAHALVVTRCPDPLPDSERKSLIAAIRPKTGQQVFFAGIRYGHPQSLEGEAIPYSRETPVIGFCGIASPAPFESHLKAHFNLKSFRSFPDHHVFSPSELRNLHAELATFADPSAILVTTSKDAERIRQSELPSNFRISHIPIETYLLGDDEAFNEMVKKATVR
ncbi:MAG: tetraacyldisaccharide 4'-kinase [Flavobacteriales bacterium]